MQLKEGHLVLLRRFEVAKHPGLKLESQWEGPYRLSHISYHQRSGQLQDIEASDVVRIRQGGRWERVHLNDLKLYVRRNTMALPAGKMIPVEANSTEIAEIEIAQGCKPGMRKFKL